MRLLPFMAVVREVYRRHWPRAFYLFFPFFPSSAVLLQVVSEAGSLARYFMADHNAAILQLLQVMQQQIQLQGEQNARILEALTNRAPTTTLPGNPPIPAAGRPQQPPPQVENPLDSSDDYESVNHAPDPNLQYRNQHPRIRADIPELSGSLHIKDFLDWISKVEKYFELMSVPEDLQVRYVAYKLKGASLAWWDNTQATRRHQLKRPVRNWVKMKQLLLA
ncbi:hypothetical protein KSP39_PZI020999 [Platanthera zijinensis]|uniref:Retrotransposon gag domain-containing protein n=1 Tax=Platanthera zijinensis TaxID=2320716 RepID=A0AAP0AXZ1_9ASPA